MDNKKLIDIELESSTKASDRVDGGRFKNIKFYSRDIDTAYFRFTFLDNFGQKVELDDRYKVTVLYIFQSDGFRDVNIGSIKNGMAIVRFDTELINQFDYVSAHIYLEFDGKSLDSHSFKFKVDLSEIDKQWEKKERPKKDNSEILDQLDLDSIRSDVIERIKQDVENSIAPIETYTHIQSSAQDKWEITHSLNKYPSVTVVDSSNQKVDGAYINYISKTKLTIEFAGAFSGMAILN